jgi:hypothetical protein
MYSQSKKLLFAATTWIIVVSAKIAVIWGLTHGSAEAKLAQVSEASIVTRTIAKGTIDNIAGAVPIEYQCELGINLTIYYDGNDDSHIFVGWENRIHRLEKVRTITGARRFESESAGLVWISISTKGILLDLKLHRQLANECKRTEFEKSEVIQSNSNPHPVKPQSTQVKDFVRA